MPPGSPASLAVLAGRVAEAHQRCRAAFRNGLEHALEAGRHLLDARSQVPHGHWLQWLEEHCGISERLAQKSMRVARELPKLDPANTPRVADLSFRQALELTASNARTTARIPLLDRPVVLDQAAEEKVSVLSDIEAQHRRRRQQAKRERRERRPRVEQEIKHAEELPPPLVPEAPLSLWGLPEQELRVLLEELMRSASWYRELAQRLQSDYNQRVPRMAEAVTQAVLDLHARLEYDQGELAQAVYWIGDQVREEPLTGKEVRSRARTASITPGLLQAARHVAMTMDLIRVVSRDGVEWWRAGPFDAGAEPAG
jgi:hypothetical protein